MDIIRLLLLLSLASIIPGQLVRFTIGSDSSAVTVTDISVIVTVFIFFIYSLFSKRKIYLARNVFYFFIIFVSCALLSLTLALNSFTISEVASGALFLLRFIFYFAIAIVTLNIVQKKEIERWLKVILALGATFSIFGLLQLLVLPDLRFLSNFGWDPHLNRLVSSLIDPNFTGGLIVLFTVVSLSLYVFKKNTFYLILSLLFIIPLILTFSRSSYLALMTAIVAIGIIKSPRLLLALLVVFLFLITAVPKSRERVISAFTLDETARSRIESWHLAYSFFSDNYLFGVGFNTFRFAQIKSGSFSVDNPEGGHSGSGADSSILLVAATTGIIGLLSFSLFLAAIFKGALTGVGKNYLKLISFASITSLIVHSQFVNSLFFPQIMVVFWFLLGLSYVRD
ncbi:MAG: hypothetical protein UU34_C0001G0047 [Candidatus Curtissbacteria bacterium GW2011_GWA1_41_11]|uniref:O-antigen ligase-related domain-containing protein n=1 Tax=Candidatus Curtissbacteria bacterium GW2011_GWA1_41_11 TaxID=1618409 RepID=A0A0G0WUD2_9BACT|nr:MAG: hypothetical protein UU34_C0001G0047 [Candidatus Curtissbacteria bacterium GW2011_GWA1_41_11]